MICLALSQNGAEGGEGGSTVSRDSRKPLPSLVTHHRLQELGQGQEDLLVQCPEWLPLHRYPEVHLATECK